MPIEKNLYDLLVKHEGFRVKAYDDGTGWEVKAPRGKLTIGYGFNIQEMDLPKIVADYWLEYLLYQIYIPKLIEIFPDFHLFTKPRKYALISMIFNLGETRFKQFKKMIAYIKEDCWLEASFECLNSKAGRDLPNRYKELAILLKDTARADFLV